MAKTQKTIEVIIEKDGSTKVEAFGFTGKNCLKETESLEEALGKLQSRTAKPEMNKTTTIADKAQVGGK